MIQKDKRFYFNWPDKKKEKLTIASYYTDTPEGIKLDGWSNQFQINKVNDFAINMNKKKFVGGENVTLM